MSKQPEEMTIEQMIATLDEAVAWFHGEDFSLDEATAKFHEVQALAAQAEARLTAMQHEIEVLEQ